jgi:hypothetical protein
LYFGESDLRLQQGSEWCLDGGVDRIADLPKTVRLTRTRHRIKCLGLAVRGRFLPQGCGQCSSQWSATLLKTNLIYGLLLGVKLFGAAFYRYKINWIGGSPSDPWYGIRLVLFLNHTSLYEPLFAGFLPNRFLKDIACNGLVPVADKTLGRPVVGQFYRWVAGDVIPVTRQRDNTWECFLGKVHENSLVILAPEGRMKRASGLDLEGMPMTIRGGVADLLMMIPRGRMLIAYSGGLHHVQVPNQMIPKLFRTLCMNIEQLDIVHYRDSILRRHGPAEFKREVIRDLESRRRTYCPV